MMAIANINLNSGKVISKCLPWIERWFCEYDSKLKRNENKDGGGESHAEIPPALFLAEREGLR